MVYGIGVCVKQEKNMTYIDGFVLAVPKANKEAFRESAEKVDILFKKHGALQVIESWADDVPKGETTDFYRAVKAKDDEAIVFSWVLWPDKAIRDTGNEKAFVEMQKMSEEIENMPFDGKRLIYGGFEAIVDL